MLCCNVYSNWMPGSEQAWPAVLNMVALGPMPLEGMASTKLRNLGNYARGTFNVKYDVMHKNPGYTGYNLALLSMSKHGLMQK